MLWRLLRNKLPVVNNSNQFCRISLLFFLIFVIPVFTSAQRGAMFTGADYHFADDLSGLSIDMNIESGKKGGWKIRGGISFGLAWGSYNDDLSLSFVENEIKKQMSGNSLKSYKLPDDTDGGFIFGGKALVVFYSKTNLSFGIGPRIDYFTEHEISVTTVSTGGGNEYTGFSQIPYKNSLLVPGMEFNLQPGGGFVLEYAYLFLPENRGGMHMLGISFLTMDW